MARFSHALRRSAVLVGLCVGALVISACGGLSGSSDSDGDENQVLRIGMASDAQSLDPPNFVLAGDFTRDNLVYETLVKLTNSGGFEPGLATSWEQASPTEWDFTLREGVKFHDGTDFDSAAVKQSLERPRPSPRARASSASSRRCRPPTR